MKTAKNEAVELLTAENSKLRAELAAAQRVAADAKHAKAEIAAERDALVRAYRQLQGYADYLEISTSIAPDALDPAKWPPNPGRPAFRVAS